MVDWPITLPASYLSGISDKKGPQRIRSAVDVGPPIVRKRYTAAVRNVALPIVLTNAERAIFDAWYDTDLEGGTLPFNWTDPVSGSTVSYRFAMDDAPDWQGSQGGEFKRWNATLQVEILP
jgi:hypothetical protein